MHVRPSLTVCSITNNILRYLQMKTMRLLDIRARSITSYTCLYCISSLGAAEKESLCAFCDGFLRVLITERRCRNVRLEINPWLFDF